MNLEMWKVLPSRLEYEWLECSKNLYQMLFHAEKSLHMGSNIESETVLSSIVMISVFSTWNIFYRLKTINQPVLTAINVQFLVILIIFSWFWIWAAWWDPFFTFLQKSNEIICWVQYFTLRKRSAVAFKWKFD